MKEKMDAYPPNTNHYPTREFNLPAIVQRLSAEELRDLKGSPLEKMVAQINPTNTTLTTNGPCIVKGQSVDNCVELIYQRAQSADEVYPGAKRIPSKDIDFASRYKFLDPEGKEWLKYFFGDGGTSQELRGIFRNDPKINFEAFYRLNTMLRGNVRRVGIFREGFIVIAVSDKITGYYVIIPISPETVEKVKAL